MGVEPDGSHGNAARDEAAGHGWKFETAPGGMSLAAVSSVLIGTHEDFLVVPPGHHIISDHDRVIDIEPVESARCRSMSTTTRLRCC
ncbi:MAG: hypothetical protein QGF67_07140 [Lentisphaeria bacterium]|jgi:hypothetical protein|nr:hypothetical protein [Lentisphaeria bacterium]MDP7741197.1 hypothetical protein [Lentisphaeria bacterium]